MFGKVIVFGLFEMIKKNIKKSEDCVLGSEFGLRVGSGATALVVTLSKRPYPRLHTLCLFFSDLHMTFVYHY